MALKTRFTRAPSEDLIGTRWELAFPEIDTSVQLLIRTFVTDAEQPEVEALNTVDQLLAGYYLVGQTSAQIGALGGRTFDRIYAPVPTLPDEVAEYQLSTYIISQNAFGWNSQGYIPNGAQQVAREIVLGADQTLNYVSGVLISTVIDPRSKVVNFTHPDGWSGYVVVTNANPNAQLEITVWGASAGRKAPLGVEDDINATVKRDFFLVGPQGWADYALATDIPKFAGGDTYSAGLRVLEPPAVTRWKGNIYERTTLVTNQVLTKKFTY